MADNQSKIKTELRIKFRNMHTRCENPKDIGFHRYGGRGIVICNEWKNFDNFYNDVSPTYRSGLTLDRINNNGNYCKENCRWITKKEQARNTRNIERAKHFTYKGITKTIREWAETVGIKRKTLSMRLLGYNWTIEKSLTREVQIGR